MRAFTPTEIVQLGQAVAQRLEEGSCQPGPSSRFVRIRGRLGGRRVTASLPTQSCDLECMGVRCLAASPRSSWLTVRKRRLADRLRCWPLPHELRSGHSQLDRRFLVRSEDPQTLETLLRPELLECALPYLFDMFEVPQVELGAGFARTTYGGPLSAGHLLKLLQCLAGLGLLFQRHLSILARPRLLRSGCPRERTCPYCREALGHSPLLDCPCCRTVYHQACLAEFGVRDCALLGCTGRPLASMGLTGS